MSVKVPAVVSFSLDIDRIAISEAVVLDARYFIIASLDVPKVGTYAVSVSIDESPDLQYFHVGSMMKGHFKPDRFFVDSQFAFGASNWHETVHIRGDAVCLVVSLKNTSPCVIKGTLGVSL